MYVNHWLAAVAPSEFVEGIHYSVMFYGGGLLRHLTANDPSVDDFISLRRLNRHSAILIDSDKTSSNARLTTTKVRVRDEFDRTDMPGFAWITACRTIENYVPIATLSAAVAQVHSRSTYVPPNDKWSEPLHITSTTGRGRAGNSEALEAPARVSPDKVRIARVAVSNWPTEEVSGEVKVQAERLAQFIRVANGSTAVLPASPAR